MRSLATMVAAAWETCLRESPDPFSESDWIFFPPQQRPSYRERLDRLRKNVYGEVITRRTVVRRNLQLLGPVRLNPARLP